MDIYAVVFFVSYLDRVYDALLNGTELPRAGGSPEKVTLERNAYLDSETYRKDFEWWKEEFSTEPLFTSINGLGGHEFIPDKRYGKDRNLLQMAAREKIFEISVELENKINRLCAEKNLSPSMVYAFAVRCFLAAVCRTDDVSLQIPVSLRATLEEKSSGLTRAEAFSFRADIPSDFSFLDGIREMDRIDRNYLRHAQIPDPNQQVKDFFGAPRECNYHSVTFSYAPFVDLSRIHLQVRATKIDSGIAITPVYILLMHTEQGKGLHMFYQYSVGYVKEENIDRCQSFVEKFLVKGLEDSNLTIRELIEESL